MIRDTLQFFNYFIRPEYKTFPDVFEAAENYKQFADKMTVEQLKEVVGKRHKIDFEALGIAIKDEEKQELLGRDEELEETFEEEPEEEVESE
jgi:hypothetical protein